VKIILWIVGLVAAALAVVALQFATMTYYGGAQPENGALIVDAKAVVRIFVDQRGVNLDEAQMKDAIKEFDRLVMAEAESIYQETGRAIINANHILAGGIDISDQFAARVIARWDAEQ